MTALRFAHLCLRGSQSEERDMRSTVNGADHTFDRLLSAGLQQAGGS